MITVHHVRNWPANPTERDVYCGRKYSRRGYNLAESVLRNPFVIGKVLTDELGYPTNQRLTRKEVIAAYKTFMEEEIDNGCGSLTRGNLSQLAYLHLTGDLRLYCWCGPKACHCDVIKAELEARL